MHLWTVLPVHELVLRREVLFQRGLERHADVVGDYEVWPGRRLVDTTPRGARRHRGRVVGAR